MKTEDEINKARLILIAQLQQSSLTKLLPDDDDLRRVNTLAAFDWVLGTESIKDFKKIHSENDVSSEIH